LFLLLLSLLFIWVKKLILYNYFFSHFNENNKNDDNFVEIYDDIVYLINTFVRYITDDDRLFFDIIVCNIVESCGFKFNFINDSNSW